MRKLFVACVLFAGILPQALYAAHGPTDSDDCFKGGAGDGWGYSTLLQPMFQGGSGDGSHVGAYSTDTAVGFGPANKIAFITQPTNSVKNAILTTSPVIEVRDAFDNRVQSATNTITMSIVNNPGSATLGGTTSKAASGGQATFSDLTINQYGTSYTIAASASGVTSATSSAFNVSYGTASKLSFTTQPSNGYAGAALTTQPIVKILDAYDNVVESATNVVALSIATDPATGSTLGGTASKAALAGVADFTGQGVYVSRAASGFALSSTSNSLTAATSSSFNISSPVQITSPNGAEVWVVSTPYSVTWDTFGSLATGQNTVQYSLNNGSTWSTISTSGTSPLSWVTPSTASVEALVRVTNSADATYTDTSNATFKIAGGFNLLVPDGGEVWANSYGHAIQWQTTGTIANVKLEYYDGSIWNTISASTANNSEYSWTPSVSSGGTGFKIRVSDPSDDDVKDESASAFTLQKISISAPTSGQRIQAGSSTVITWSSQGVTNVKVEYSVDDGSWATLTASTAASGGSYTWSVPSDFSASTNVKVRVSGTAADSDGNTVQATSGAFSIYGQLTLAIPSASGVEWAANQAHDITWTTNKGTISNVKLEYSSDNFVADVNTIVASTANTGSYSWTPTSTGTTFKVRVSDAQDSQTSDASDNYFSVTGIGITAPAEGATWNCGTSQNITWNYTGSFSNVKIEYYDGASWNTIAGSTVNDGSYTWTVAATPTNAAKIRISDAADSDPITTSSTFNIKSVIAVTVPNGGESYAVGSTADITWTVAGSVSNVKIEYSTNNGSSWSNVVESEGTANDGVVTNDGTFSWAVPDAVTAQALIRISDNDSGHPASSDTSNAVFSITTGITITSPTSGLNWAVGEAHNITWTNTGTISAVRIYYATENDSYATWTEITSGAIANSNTYSWTVSDAIQAVGQNPQSDRTLAVKVKVTDADAGHPTASGSSSAFNVIYYAITWTLKDSQTLSELAGLSVSCTSGWSASSLTSGAVRNYPYGTYTTIWSRTNYVDKSYASWVADSNKTISLTMVLAAVAGQEYHVYSDFTYDYASDAFNINAWLEQGGSIVTGPTSCAIAVEDKNGNVVDVNGSATGNNLTSSSPNANGVFRMTLDLTNLNRNTTYMGKVQMIYNATTYSSNLVYAIAVPAAVKVQQVTDLGAQFVSHQAATEPAIADIKTSVGTGLANKVNTLQTDVSTLKADTATIKTDTTSIKSAVGASESTTLYSKATQILEDTGTTIPATVVSELKKGTRSKILNRPTSLNKGDTTTISYKTDSGLSPVITVYDPSNNVKISSAAMTEIGTTGVYEYNITFDSSWGTGDFTIICSEATTSSADSMTISVGAGGTLVSVEAKLDTLTTALNTVSTNISSIKAIVGNTSDASTVNTLYGKLAGVTGNVNTVLTKWGDYSASQIVTSVDSVGTILGSPTNVSGQQTVFGKIADVRNYIGDMPDVTAVVNNAYTEVQNLRKEVDFNGKSDTAYNLIKNINVTIEELKRSLVAVPDQATASSTEQMAVTLQEARKTVQEIAAKEGIKGTVAGKDGRKAPATLEDLRGEISELKASTETMKAILQKKIEEPVIKTWFESGSVVLKMVVVNPSSTDTKTVPVKTYLPKGVEPEHIMEMGNFKISYDFEQSLYYVYQDVTLAPKESVELKVEIQDIWVIPEEEIKSAREHVGKIVTGLEKSEYYKQAKFLGENITQRLDAISQTQNISGLSVERKLSDYETNNKIFFEIKRDVGTLEDLAIEVGTLSGQKLMGETNAPDVTHVDETDKSKMELGTIKFKIAIFNPSADPRIMPLDYYLPKEATPQFIVDSGGLEVGFDSSKGLHYVYKKEGVKLESLKTQEFTVEIKDVWVIADKKIETMRLHADKLLTLLKETPLSAQAILLGDRVKALLAEIVAVQSKKDVSADRHIADYRKNLFRLDEAKRTLTKLEKLLVQMGGSAGITTEASANGTRKARGETSMAAKGIELLAKSIFRGKAPNVTTTWKIIWVIIGFLGLVSFLFFILWWTQIKVNAAKKQDNVR